MAIIKCKMCGGDLNIVEGATVAECEYCGTKQTVPSTDNEKKLTLFGRAGRLLRACEFDKAAGVYESIVADFPEEAEAYWGLVLCKYGIEYVDDPATGKKIPTCHRSSFDSVMDDSNFDQACENADAVARRLYRDEAKAIEELRRGIIEVSGKEAPYDIFICYKETDENGERTLDSVLAQDIYDALTEKGYRVFFSRVTLEDKLGQEYEPYIFAALNSAKVMLAVGTDYDYYNAVWVKNEWSRFLQLIAGGQKKTLIPCYKNIDAYDMPKEFAKLQAQDLGKVGAMQDLLRGVDKLLGKGQTAAQAAPVQTVVQQVQQVSSGPSVDSLLKRGQIFLNDGEWAQADEYFDKVLDIDPENARAYFSRLLATRKAESSNKLAEQGQEIADDPLFQKALRYADEAYKAELNAVNAAVQQGHQKALIEQEKARKITEKRLAPICKQAKELSHLILAGHSETIGIKVDGTLFIAGNTVMEKYTRRDLQSWSNIKAIYSSIYGYFGLKEDGSVVVSTITTLNLEKFHVEGWKNIIALSEGLYHTVGLRSDGTVIAAGKNDYGQCNVSSWKNVKAIYAARNKTYGLLSDGSVITTGEKEDDTEDVGKWTDIVDIPDMKIGYTMGLKSDGTVAFAGKIVNGKADESVSAWRNIIAIAEGRAHTVGLHSDGSVVAVGQNQFGQCNVQEWTNIVAIYAAADYTLGLRADGSAVVTGCFTTYSEDEEKDSEQYRVKLWKENSDLVALSAGSNHIVGLKSDGTLIATGSKNYGQKRGQCNVEEAELFNYVDTLEEERQAIRNAAEEKRKKEAEELARKRAEEVRKREEQEAARKKAIEQENERHKARLNQEAASLKTELANLRGLFTGKRRKQIETRLVEIDRELNKLK